MYPEDDGCADSYKPMLDFYIEKTQDREMNDYFEATVYADDEEIEGFSGYDRAELVKQIEEKYPAATER